MKTLLFADKRVILNQDTYLPFVQKVSSLDDITINGTLATKQITIPRCPENDEIMGYLCNISKKNIFQSDNKIGVSINQIKRIPFKLFLNSDLISEGIVRIISVNDDGYVVELYDKIIDILEEFSGDETNNQGFLNNLDIVLGDSEYFSAYATPYDIKYLVQINSEIKPCVNLTDFDYNGNKARITVNNGTTTSFNTVTLPTDLTPLQFGSIKSYDYEFACPVSTVIRSINEQYGILEVDSSLTTLFDELHYNMGKPKPIRIDNTTTFKNNTFDTTVGFTYYSGALPTPSFSRMKLVNQFNVNLARDNGKYTVKFLLEGNLYPSAELTSQYFGGGFKNGQVYQPFPYNAPSGTSLTKIWLGFNIARCGGTNDLTKFIQSKTSYVEIELVKDVNCTVSNDGFGNITGVYFSQYVEFDIEYYYSVYEQLVASNNYLYIDYSKMWYLNVDNYSWAFLNDDGMGGYDEYQYTFVPNISECTLRRQYNDMRTGDLLYGNNLFPKISIKEWLLALVKYLNLKLEITSSGSLLISKKSYVQSPEVLLIDGTPDIEFSNINFSKMVMSTNTGTDDDISEYENNKKITYGAKIINTGYTIKNQRKDIKFDIQIPILKTDYNSYAYGEFAQYRNNGYSKLNYGLTKSNNGIMFGFINTYNTPIWVSRDTPYEANLISGTMIPVEKEFTHTNLKMTYYTSTSEYIYPTKDSVTGDRLVEKQYTLSPYKFSGNTIIESLELNKGDYSYAGIINTNYPETTTVYDRIWKNLIIDMYDSNSHILNARIYIENKFNIYAIYNIKNTTYIPIEIEEYDPTVPGIYNIKFLRVNNTTNYTN